MQCSELLTRLGLHVYLSILQTDSTVYSLERSKKNMNEKIIDAFTNNEKAKRQKFSMTYLVTQIKVIRYYAQFVVLYVTFSVSSNF
jgi:hypothetical protein